MPGPGDDGARAEPARTGDRRERVETWLRSWSADLADLYLAAVRLLHGAHDVPAHLRLAAHAAREILNNLPNFVAPGERRRLDYRKHVAALRQAVPDLPFDGATGGPFVLPATAIDVLRQLFADHEAVGNENVERARRMLAAATRSPHPELLRPLARRWYELYQLFMRDVHVGASATTSWTEDEYRSRFGQVEDILATLADEFFAPFDDLDAVLADPQSTVDAAVALAVHTEQLRYLFEKLDRPEWVGGLAERGYFASPPEPVLEEDGRFVRFPNWPALSYLARVADRAQDEVLQAASRVPPTENLSVAAGLFDVALRLPATHAARLLPRLLDSIGGSEPLHTLLEHRVEPLIAHLARGGEVAGAEKVLTLAAKALRPRTKYGRPTMRMPAWAYDRLLTTNVPVLLDVDPQRFFETFISMLNAAVRAGVTREEARAGHASSVGWRDVVASGHGYMEDPRDVLVEAVRDASLRLATDAAGVARGVERLERESFSIFKRISLHLLHERVSIAPDLAHQHVMARDLFDSYECRPEYSRLVAAAFGALGEADKRTWLSWVDAGPDLSGLEERYVPPEGGPSLDDIKRDQRERWQLERLALVADELEGERKASYLALEQRYGKPKDPRTPQAAEVRVGPTSPFEGTELRSLSVDALVAKLQAWVPPDEWMGPSPAGVGRQVTEAVAANPAAYADTEKFTVLEPTYVRSVIDGFHTAASAGREVPWEPALRLLDWVVRQPFTHDVAPDFQRDPGWRWSRMSATRLVNAGIARKVVPYALRERVWDCIAKLLHDPDPTPEDEGDRIERGTDAADLSMNATRSVALDGAMHYCAWVRHHVEGEGFRLDVVPEARLAFDEHLDAVREPSRAVRWVFGRWFRFLVGADETWAASHVEDIFGGRDADGELELTAWDAFVSSNVADDAGYSVLRDQYVRAVERLGRGVRTVRRVNDADEMLAQHLVRLFWTGTIELDAEESPLRRFYELAPAALRAHLVEFVGRALYGTNASGIPDAIAQRLRLFWEARMRAMQSLPASESAAEAAAFGWWFAAGKLGDEWLLEQLASALGLCARIDSSMLVVERLATLVTQHPNRVLACLELLVRGDNIGWNIESWKRHVVVVLEATLQRGDTTERARAVVNELGRLGFHEYRVLLGGGPPPQE